MAAKTAISSLPSFKSFGEMLRYLRRQTRLTQRELAIAVGYSESMISRLEHGERPPDVATIHGLIVPALLLEKQPDVVARLIELANAARGGKGEGGWQRPADSMRRALSPEHRLPARLVSLVGRTEDVRNVAGLLAEKRLVTLTGPGGCGKTSLALEVCRYLVEPDSLGNVGDGDDCGSANEPIFDVVCLVELFPVNDPNLLAQSVLAALGGESGKDQEATEVLLAAIQSRAVLLVLDNCEHMIDAAAHLVQTLLQGCRNLRVIASSRERLSIPAETVYSVKPLPCPQANQQPDLGDMMSFPAVQLFVERSRAVAPDFRLTAENAAYVAEICTLLDGIPLALELGAAATATFSVQDIAQRLQGHMLLSGPGFRVGDPRHASINDTVAWSYNLLSAIEQRMLTRLSVFAGGWTVKAIQHVCADLHDPSAILSQLVQKSLVNIAQTGSSAGQTRYHMLRAVHEYAAERLAGSGEEELARRRHCEYYCWYGAKLGDQVLGPEHHHAMADLDADHANLRAALAFGRDRADLAEPYARLAAALPYYWRRRGYYAESYLLLHRLLGDNCDLSLPTQALALAAVLQEMSTDTYYWGQNIADQAEFTRLVEAADALISRCMEHGSHRAAARLMVAAGGLHERRDGADPSEGYARKARAIFLAQEDMRGAALATILLVSLLLFQSKYDEALDVLEEIIPGLEHNRMTWCLCEAYWLQSEIGRHTEDRTAEVKILKRIAKIAEQEEFPKVIHEAYVTLEYYTPITAVNMAEGFLARQRQKAPSAMLAMALHQLGRMYLNLGRYQAAEKVLDEVLQLYARLPLRMGESPGPEWSLIDRGEVARYQGDMELAAVCFSESIRLFTASPWQIFSVHPLLFRAQVYLEERDLSAAILDFRRCLRVAMGEQPTMSFMIFRCMAGIAEIARQRGDLPVAAKLYAKAAELEANWRTAPEYGQPHMMEFYDRLMNCVSDYRQDPEFETAWQDGLRLTPDKALQLALSW
ncbi:MAG: helix-turn-helix domain-containing protein [Caldilineaceae bacterium]